MFDVGDLVVYSAHGVCRIDDICDKTFAGATRTYYVMHPLEDPNLILNIPKDHATLAVLELLDREEAESLISSFCQPGSTWIENNNQRAQAFRHIIDTGSREKVAQIANTLMRRKHEAEQNGKQLGQADSRTLTSIQKILFSELAISLNTTEDAIEERVSDMVAEQSLIS